MYAYLAAAPFMFGSVLHRPAHEVGFYILVMIAAVASASVAASRLAGRVQ